MSPKKKNGTGKKKINHSRFLYKLTPFCVEGGISTFIIKPKKCKQFNKQFWGRFLRLKL